MSSGYKPAPLDLNHVKLTPNQNTLVERLAENGHNVWARDRVRQGWTYSIVQVCSPSSSLVHVSFNVPLVNYDTFATSFRSGLYDLTF